MKILDGKVIADQIKDELAKEIRALINQGLRTPHLAAVLVGDDHASKTYVSNKERACKEVGFLSSVYALPESTSEKELLELVRFINTEDEVDGLLIQLPLPEHINESVVIEAIDPQKDVDGFHPVNLGRMMLGLPSFVPATPAGILEMLSRSGIPTEGKHCVVAGRSHTVGTPVALLMSRKSTPGNSTVTLCHSKTENLSSHTLLADILIAAIGKPGFFTADMVKRGATVIDVGIHRVPDAESKTGFRLTGDVDFKGVSEVAGWISPVPGGVGPMTIVSLLRNTMKAFRKEVYG